MLRRTVSLTLTLTLTVRITVICHDTRLSGFGLEARIEDQKLKQGLKIRN